MASSYVEVKESSHDADSEPLPFDISTCESNGVDIQTQIDGEPPKDHTYNKDPDVSEEEVIADDTPVDKSKTDQVDQKSSTRTQRNTKHKIIKPRPTSKPPATKPLPKKEKENLKKISRKKPVEPASKKSPEVKEDKDDKKSKEDKDSHEDVKNDVSSIKPEDTENISPEPTQTKKKPRKRKGTSESSETERKQIKTSEPDSKENDSVEEKEVVEEDNDEEEEEEEEEKVVEKSPKKKPVSSKGKPVQKTRAVTKPEKTKSVTKEKAEEASIAQKDAQGKKTKSKDVGQPDSTLPRGWTRKIVERKSGKTAGSFDIYIYSPEGIKFRSRPDIAAYLSKTKSNLKLEDFNFTKKGLNLSTIKADSGGKSGVSKAKAAAPQKKAQTKPVVKEKKKSAGPMKKGGKLVVKLSTPRKNVLSDKQNHDSQKKEDKKVASQRNKTTEGNPSDANAGASKRSENSRRGKK